MKSYDYITRKGVDRITWINFGEMASQLSACLEPLNVQGIVGIARGGLFPATACACILRCELYPVRITRRLNDQVCYAHPQWITPVSELVAGKIIAVIDEIADTGETLSLVAKETLRKGAVQVISACLVSHSWADPKPDISLKVSDALVIFPWDEFVLDHGSWALHPEIQDALNKQKGSSQDSDE
ncbi:MAG TPA: phosphoribosyltransferase [Anaerolineales bacterium]|nr:phosphoribosyltransferase [Anaerolineales bacterium]